MNLGYDLSAGLRNIKGLSRNIKDRYKLRNKIKKDARDSLKNKASGGTVRMKSGGTVVDSYDYS